MVSQTLTVQVTSGGGGSVTRTFQEGVAGYNGTADTYLRQAGPTTSYGTASLLDVDNAEDSAGNDTQSLLIFNSIFGSGASQIPAGAWIASARLELNVTNAGSPIAFHRMISAWDEGRTWSTQGSGISANDVEAKATADVVTGPVKTGILSVDVTSSLRAWQQNPSAMRGWAILPTGSDGVDIHSENNTVKPKLIVTYTMPAASSVTMAAAPANESSTAAAESQNAGGDDPPRAAVTTESPAHEDTRQRTPANPSEHSPATRRRPVRPRAAANDAALDDLYTR
jgi:hypothetical protein